MCSRPILGVAHQRLTDSAASMMFIHHQTSDLDGRIRYQRGMYQQVDPRDHRAVGFSDIDPMVGVLVQRLQPVASLLGRGGLAQLDSETGDGAGVFGRCGADRGLRRHCGNANEPGW